jgi:Carboxypeptidase regulatory-like domain
MKLVRLALLTVLAIRIVAQTPEPASIRGTVVKWGTSEPIAQAVVELRNPADTSGVPLISTAARANGEYVFPQVPPGRYRIIATRKGFAPGEYGRQRVSGAGSIVTLTASQRLANANIEMAAGASVSGRVYYANGDPMPVARVQVMKLGYRNGTPELTAQQSTYTNDLGEYRLFWLAPGSYYVSAENAQNNTTPQLLVNPNGNGTYSWSGVFGSPRPTARIARDYGTADEQTYITTYYPGTTGWENASLLELRAGDEATNINITLSAAAQRRIRGVILDSNRQPVQGTIVVSLRQLDASLPVNARTLQFFPDNGRFQFVVTQSGTYELTTTVGMLSGRAVATVRDRDTDVSISLFPATNLAGQVILDGAVTPNTPQGPGPTVILRPPNGQPLSSPVNANGTFAFENLRVSTYRVEVSMPAMPDAYLKNVRIKDADVPDGELLVDGYPTGELQLLVAGAGGSIEGRVVSDRQQSVMNATVVVLPEGLPGYRADRYRSATVDGTGAFQFRGLPAGQYNVYAWIDVDNGAWFNPAFLRNYDTYRRSFVVADRKKETVDIVAVPVMP